MAKLAFKLDLDRRNEPTPGHGGGGQHVPVDPRLGEGAGSLLLDVGGDDTSSDYHLPQNNGRPELVNNDHRPPLQYSEPNSGRPSDVDLKDTISFVTWTPPLLEKAVHCIAHYIYKYDAELLRMGIENANQLAQAKGQHVVR